MGVIADPRSSRTSPLPGATDALTSNTNREIDTATPAKLICCDWALEYLHLDCVQQGDVINCVLNALYRAAQRLKTS